MTSRYALGHESASVGMVLMMHNTSFLSVNVIVMVNDITTIWQGSENEGSLSLTVSFLLAPFSNIKLTFKEAQEILLAVFCLIRRFSLCL